MARGPQLIVREVKGSRDAPQQSHRVAVLALPGSDLFDIAGPYEAFMLAGQVVQRQRQLAAPYYSVDLLTIGERSVKTWLGLQIGGTQDFLQYPHTLDTLIVTGRPDLDRLDGWEAPLVTWLQQKVPRVRRICSVCTGVFALAHAGILDGRRATTHWQYAGELARRYPKIAVNPESVFVRDGNVYTSAGCTAAMDLALALIEDDVGKAAAFEAAREMVMFMRRPGGHAQVSSILAIQMADREPLRELQDWILENLHLPLTVEDLAERVHMSPRNFARAFTKEVEVTPARYLATLRLEAARRRLEETSRSLDKIAAECGFGGAEAMCRCFVRNLGKTPSAYRSHLQSA